MYDIVDNMNNDVYNISYSNRNLTSSDDEFDANFNQNNLLIENIIGKGFFSKVYYGIYKQNIPSAVKILNKTDNQQLVINEIQILNQLKGKENIIELLHAYTDLRNPILVFEYVNSIDLINCYQKLSLNHVRLIFRGILTGLSSAHSLGIAHRDIKIDNILVSRKRFDVKIIDWGCAAKVGTENMRSKAGSRLCYSPEMLLESPNVDTSCDIWAVGVLMLSLLTGGFIPWKGRTKHEILKKMSQYFGSQGFEAILAKSGSRYPKDVDQSDFFVFSELDIEETFDPDMIHLQYDELIDLMMQMLTVDPTKRITAKEALCHQFFRR